MYVNLGLGGMFLSDYLYKYKDDNLNHFITSKSSEGNDELIKIAVVILDKGHPEYKNIGLDVDLVFNTLIVNFKPETLAKVLLLIKPESVESQTGPTSDMLRQLENEVSATNIVST